LDLTLLIVLDEEQVDWHSVCNTQYLFLITHASHHITFMCDCIWLLCPCPLGNGSVNCHVL